MHILWSYLRPHGRLAALALLLAKALREYVTRLVVKKWVRRFSTTACASCCARNSRNSKTCLVLTGLLSREIKGQQCSIVRETNRNSGFITESLRNVELIGERPTGQR